MQHRTAPERDTPPADDTIGMREDQRAVIVALQRLPRRQREVIVLRYWAEQTEEEIATTLAISRGSVKTHAHRGMAALQRELGE
jgi:RNA polymerase sigma factor (sigma-70 family)